MPTSVPCASAKGSIRDLGAYTSSGGSLTYLSKQKNYYIILWRKKWVPQNVQSVQYVPAKVPLGKIS